MIYFLINSTVVEVGAGLGCYASFFSKLLQSKQLCGYLAVDGAPHVDEISKGSVLRVDMTLPQRLPICDWVLCLEVAEHIPAKFEEIFLRNMLNVASKGIVLSWASNCHRGVGHVNCKTRDEFVELLESPKYGMKYEEGLTAAMGRSVDYHYFKSSLAVFTKKGI